MIGSSSLFASSFIQAFFGPFSILYLFPIDYVDCIDVCQSDGNLLAAGDARKINIFDKRESRVVRKLFVTGKIFDAITLFSLLLET